MKRITVVTLAVAAFAGLMLAGPASAEAGIKRLAKAECRADRAEEPAEFAAQYGGSGKAALKRCARIQRREARADCRGDRAEEPAEFAAQYGGSGRDAIKRCMRDELR